MSEPVRIVAADLDNSEHQSAVIELIREYARDPMGHGNDLPPEVLSHLIPGLRAHPTCLIFLAYRGREAVGIAVCFVGFSTFAARPLINVHDLAVSPRARQQGVGSALLERVEAQARERGCGKITLEVREDNLGAQRLYQSLGFASPNENPDSATLFLTKEL